MPLDITQTDLGYELASLRALGEDRRRQSLVARLMRERRKGTVIPDGQRSAKAPPVLPLRPQP